jgi:NADH:quinone reductase (non-electrogenic)
VLHKCTSVRHAVKAQSLSVDGISIDGFGDVDAGIWSVGTAMGLINDIPTVGELVLRIVEEVEELITGRRADMVEPEAEENVA